jgi:hypothetical protein
MAAVLTSKEVDDAARVGPLLDQVTGPLASLTADGAMTRTAFTPMLPNVTQRRR